MIDPTKRIIIAKKVDKTAIILGKIWTKTIQIIPIAKEIKRLNLMVSYVFKKVHLLSSPMF